MLVRAIDYTSEEINKLIRNEEFKYADFSAYKSYDVVQIESDEWRKIQRVSISEDGRILGYFSANTDYVQELISSLFLTKFKSTYLTPEDHKVAMEDLDTFIESLVSDKRFYRIKLCCIDENPANKLYNKWVARYGGSAHLEEDAVKLIDNERYGEIRYIINTEKYYRDRS